MVTTLAVSGGRTRKVGRRGPAPCGTRGSGRHIRSPGKGTVRVTPPLRSRATVCSVGERRVPHADRLGPMAPASGGAGPVQLRRSCGLLVRTLPVTIVQGLPRKWAGAATCGPRGRRTRRGCVTERRWTQPLAKQVHVEQRQIEAGVVGGVGGGEMSHSAEVGGLQNAQPPLEGVVGGRRLQPELAGDDLAERGQVRPPRLERGW